MTELPLATPGQPQCGAVVGPVWKLDGESWACQRPTSHADWHATADGTWWAPNPITEETES